MASSDAIANVLSKRGKQLQADWVKDLAASAAAGAISRSGIEELDKQAGQFLQLLAAAAQSRQSGLGAVAQDKPLREFLELLSRARAQQGFSSAETATFIFSFKRVLFQALRAESGTDSEALANQIMGGHGAARWRASAMARRRISAPSE